MGDRQEAKRLVDLATTAATEIGLGSIATSVEFVRARLDTTGRPGRHGTADPDNTPGVFRRTGSSWEVEYAGRTVLVQHARGLLDIARLLSRPGEAVAAVELLGEPAATASAARGAEVFDERARREIREAPRVGPGGR